MLVRTQTGQKRLMNKLWVLKTPSSLFGTIQHGSKQRNEPRNPEISRFDPLKAAGAPLALMV